MPNDLSYRLGIPLEEGRYSGSEYSRRVEHGLIVERNVVVPMRDGVRLLVDVIRPPGPGPFPVLLTYSPYGKHSRKSVEMFGGDEAGPGYAIGQLSHYTVWEGPDPLFWTSHGFAVVNSDSRGSWGSEGTLTFYSAKEAEDGYDLVEWCGHQPWSNGNVGMSGVSYLASSQWSVAATQPPSLKAINPWEGASDQFRDRATHGGIRETRFRTWWLESTSYSRTRVEDVLVMSATHPVFDSYWAERAPDLTAIQVPVYAVADWGDQGVHTRGTIEGFKRASSEHKWLEVHGRYKWPYFYGEESVQRQLAFFSSFLVSGAPAFERPKVSVEVREGYLVGDVHDEEQWPLLDTKYRPLFLDAAEGVLALDPPLSEASVGYDSESGSAHFEFEFSEDTEITGNVRLQVWMQTDEATDLDVFVGLEKLSADGAKVGFVAQSMFSDGPVALGWLRASHREIDESRSTEGQPWHPHDREVPVPVGVPVLLDIEILPSSTLFRAGERLQLIIQGRDLYPYPGETVALGHDNTRNQGAHIVCTGGEHASRLVIPVVERSIPAPSGQGNRQHPA
jgi:predicted acyl esterase